MGVIRIKLESEIDFIPIFKRVSKSKYFEFKFLFVRLIIKGII